MKPAILKKTDELLHEIDGLLGPTLEDAFPGWSEVEEDSDWFSRWPSACPPECECRQEARDQEARDLIARRASSTSFDCRSFEIDGIAYRPLSQESGPSGMGEPASPEPMSVPDLFRMPASFREETHIPEFENTPRPDPERLASWRHLRDLVRIRA